MGIIHVGTLVFTVLALVAGNDFHVHQCSCNNRHLNCTGNVNWDYVMKSALSCQGIYKLEATHGYLTTVGERVCELNQTLTHLSLSSNNISQLPQISCLTQLVKLDLDNNNLKDFYISVVAGMANLTTLSLSFNNIRNMYYGGSNSNESFEVLGSLKSLEFLFLRNNSIETADIYLFALSKLRLVNMTYNNISKITNTLGVDLTNQAFTKGRGFTLDLNFNQLKTVTLADMKSFGYDIESQEMLRVWISYCVLVENNPWSCDCTMTSTIKRLSTSNTAAAFKSNACLKTFIEAKCNTPEKFKGRRMFNLTTEEMDGSCYVYDGCPKSDEGTCVCRRNDTEGLLVDVDCSHQNLTKVPDIDLPHSLLNVNLDNTKIRRLEWKSYMNATKSLSAANSSIDEIDETFWSNLSKSLMSDLNLSYTNIKSLPQSVENYDYPLKTISLDGRSYSCECDFVFWFEKWLKDKTVQVKVSNRGRILCSDGIPIENWSNHSVVFMCYTPWIALISAIFVFLLTCLITSYVFREELRVLMYRYWGMCCHPRRKDYVMENKENNNGPQYKYDVYIFCADNDIRWAKDNILDYLENRAMDFCPYRYDVGFQERNFRPGLDQVDNMTNAVNCSRRFLFVLSPHMLRSVDCRNAFERANHVALREGKRKIIIVQREKLTREQRDREPEIGPYINSQYCLEPRDGLFREKLCYRLPPKQKELYDDDAVKQIEIIM